MPEFIARTLLGQRLNLVLVASFAGLALLLASLGLYSVVSHLTARRSREFSVRLAVGATRANLLTAVLRESQSCLHGVCRPPPPRRRGYAPTLERDPRRHKSGSLTHISVAALLLIVVLVASYLPARRASRTDPVFSPADS